MHRSPPPPPPPGVRCASPRSCEAASLSTLSSYTSFARFRRCGLLPLSSTIASSFVIREMPAVRRLCPQKPKRLVFIGKLLSNFQPRGDNQILGFYGKCSLEPTLIYLGGFVLDAGLNKDCSHISVELCCWTAYFRVMSLMDYGFGNLMCRFVYSLMECVVNGIVMLEQYCDVTVVDDLVWTEGLIRVSFGITRLIRVSFGITRLICVSFRITRLICKGNARGRPTRGKKDALKESLVVVRKMPPRKGARRDSRGGRGRGAGCVQPEVHPVAQATDPAAPVTHADLAAMEKRFRDLIMQMREPQHSALLAPAQAPVCPDDQKVQCTIFMLTERGPACLRDAKRQEFLNLEQGDRIVEQYDANFDMLSRFAPEIIATKVASNNNNNNNNNNKKINNKM
ncbi:gag-protease polyprotein [Cucumis melo var. makuwa]|uniref:Gag-protease polyprotein n=1 Tax=Cucumis melo var. makuwa TaxID=1194695 RepID=A0A5A7TZ10_CUCMM|nr:gag-protease polyprotein [Cucumis melo var. makuwa]